MHLNWPGTSQAKLSTAIAHSIRTPGKLLFNTFAVSDAQARPIFISVHVMQWDHSP